jgi:hypothetical protein
MKGIGDETVDMKCQYPEIIGNIITVIATISVSGEATCYPRPE